MAEGENQTTTEELQEVLTTLRTKGRKAATAEEVIEAIDAAIRSVRNRGQTVKVNGENRPDLARGEATEETSSTPGGGGEGPITSPEQVEGPSTPLEIVRDGDPAVLGRWFRAEGASLVWTAEGTTWRKEHRDVSLDATSSLVDVTHSSERLDRGWRLGVTFVISVGEETRRTPHRFFVTPGGEDDGFGAKIDGLKFEGYQMADALP